MNTQPPHIFHQQLEQRIQPFLQQPPDTPITIQLEEQYFVVKFNRREPGRLWRESMSALACRVAFGLAVSPRAFRAGSIDYEAQRLKNLQAHHIAVPKLLLSQPQYIVMEHCGASIESMLNDQHQRDMLLPRIVENLLELHKAGQWHGGAQVRNLTLKNDHIFRIDFEEKTGDALPLYMAQAYDVILCFNSLGKYMNFDLDRGEQLLTQYLSQHQDPNMYDTLHRVLRLLLRLHHVITLFGEKLQNRSDIQRTWYFTRILKRSLHHSKSDYDSAK